MPVLPTRSILAPPAKDSRHTAIQPGAICEPVATRLGRNPLSEKPPVAGGGNGGANAEAVGAGQRQSVVRSAPQDPFTGSKPRLMPLQTAERVAHVGMVNGKAQIARDLGVSRNTLSNYLDRIN